MTANEMDIGMCPRCGRELVRGTTPTGKVCFRCPSCGGVAVTLPALRESIGAESIAALTAAARAGERTGCACPGCGGDMSLLKVGAGKDKIEVDVCGRCLSVWCDKGEYEALAPPPPPKPDQPTMKQLLERTSPEARERYAATMVDSLPEDVSPTNFDLEDILYDVVRLVVGAPSLWRKVRPVSPIFAIALTLSLPIAQACIFYSCHDIATGVGGYSISPYRDFWILSEQMARKCGFDISHPLTAITFPFVQASGRIALIYAFFLFVPLAAMERRMGHRRFVQLFLKLLAVSVLAQTLFVAVGAASGRLVGIVPVALGFLVYSSFAWPDLRIKDSLGLMSIYSGLVGLALLVFALLGDSAREYLSIGVGAIAACIALGAFLGRRLRLANERGARS